MITLNALCLPEPMVERLRAAGYNTIGDLHASNPFTVRIRTRFTADDVEQLVVAMRKIGWDFHDPGDDPVGAENYPSAVALRSLFDALRFMPRTAKQFKFHLLGVNTRSELLAWCNEGDRETIARLLELMGGPET